MHAISDRKQINSCLGKKRLQKFHTTVYRKTIMWKPS